MSIIGALICMVIGAGMWWMHSAGGNVTIYDPVLNGVMEASTYVFFGLGIILAAFSVYRSRNFK